MLNTGLWLRVFVGLIFAVLPPILLLVAAVVFSESVLRGTDPSVVAVAVVLGAIVWGAILAIVYTRVLSDDIRSVLSMAERGERLPDAELGAASQQLATRLEERNRQVATLARESSAIPIDEHPTRVIQAVVASVRSVMGDPTWRCAILDSDQRELLPTGIHLGTDEPSDPGAIGDLERWASTTGDGQPVRHAEGPWGAFVIVDLPIGAAIRSILYAPWEGRAAPTLSDSALLRLVAEHAGTALDHSLLYARVRSQADELNRLAGVQGDFLRGVTHDLQTPLTSIGALATELGANPAIPDQARGDLDTITHQADRLRRMVSQLLVASRLEAGVLKPEVEVFALRPIVERTWHALRADRPFSLAESGPPHLAVGDPDRFEQVAWALLDNAVKYSADGSPIEVAVASGAGSLSLTVVDHGTGMEEATRLHAFDQFYRADTARRLAPDGSGVGLYAARGLVEAMGGSVAIKSALGAGTAVTVHLPAEPSGKAE
jgi:signal transduction histidine kinase